jgi:hypothetical protein
MMLVWTQKHVMPIININMQTIIDRDMAFLILIISIKSKLGYAHLTLVTVGVQI